MTACLRAILLRMAQADLQLVQAVVDDEDIDRAEHIHPQDERRLVIELPAIEYGTAWGEITGDLYLNDEAYFANVPELVWSYQLGGYPVQKKWLGYRQADRRDGQPLTDDERRWLRQIIQRIAALLALGPSLDALYQEAAANAFTAQELGIIR